MESWSTRSRRRKPPESIYTPLDMSSLAQNQAANIATDLVPEKLRAVFAELATLHTTFVAEIDVYKGRSQTLVMALNQVLDAQSETTGWQEFLDIARQPVDLHSVLFEREVLSTVKKEFDAALRQIDRAKEQVLEDKFSDYSSTIQSWWERLRPDEPTFFPPCGPGRGQNARSTSRLGSPPTPTARLRRCAM